MNLSTFFAIVGIIGFLFLCIMHEQVHVQIFNSYGIDSKVDYIHHLPDFVTIANKSCPNDTCELAHNINEAISYPLNMVYCLLFLGLLCVIILLEER